MRTNADDAHALHQARQLWQASFNQMLYPEAYHRKTFGADSIDVLLTLLNPHAAPVVQPDTHMRAAVVKPAGNQAASTSAIAATNVSANSTRGKQRSTSTSTSYWAPEPRPPVNRFASEPVQKVSSHESDVFVDRIVPPASGPPALVSEQAQTLTETVPAPAPTPTTTPDTLPVAKQAPLNRASQQGEPQLEQPESSQAAAALHVQVAPPQQQCTPQVTTDSMPNEPKLSKTHPFLEPSPMARSLRGGRSRGRGRADRAQHLSAPASSATTSLPIAPAIAALTITTHAPATAAVPATSSQPKSTLWSPPVVTANPSFIMVHQPKKSS